MAMATSKKNKEMAEFVSHHQITQLLHNKFVVVLGDSIQRGVYKDLVLLLQKERFLTREQLRKKGEMSFELDCLIEGGCLNHMHNGTEYKEVRQFQSPNHLVRFYFATRIYSLYMQSILEDFRKGMKPDVVIVNSCVWDISRYSTKWVDEYKQNLCRFFDELSGILPEETLVIWSLTMPLADKIKGGFLAPEIEHKAPYLRSDVVEANFFSATLADSYGMDVLDFHFHFRFSHEHRLNDGVHWNSLAHRKITSLLLQHAAQAWGVNMPCSRSAVERYDNDPPIKFYSDSLPRERYNFEVGPWQEPAPHRDTGSNRLHRPSHPTEPYLPYQPVHRCKYNQYGHGGNEHSGAPVTQPVHGSAYEEYADDPTEFYSDSLPRDHYNFEIGPWQEPASHRDTGSNRPFTAEPYQPVHRRRYNQYGNARNGFHFEPEHLYDPYNEHHHESAMSRHGRHRYAPYTYNRPHRFVSHCSDY